MPILKSSARALARVVTAADIAAFRALRHKIVEPPRCEIRNAAFPHQSHREHFDEVVLP